MKIIPKMSKRATPNVISLLIMALVFGYYFFIHIPQQKEKLIIDNYRELAKSGEFIKLRYRDFLKQDSTKYCIAIKSALEQNLMNTEVFDIFQIIPVSNNNIKDCELYHNISVKNVDSLLYLKDGVATASLKEIKISEIKYMFFVHHEKINTKNSDRVKKYNKNKPKLNIETKTETETIVKTKTETETETNTKTKTESITESTTDEHNISNGDTNQEVTDIYFCGLIEKSKFDSDIRKVNTRVIINASILLFLLLMAMPLLKFVFLSPIERLGRYNVVWLGASIILGTGLVILLCLSFYLDSNFRHEINHKLKVLNNSISAQFIQEIEEGYEFLNEYDNAAQICNDCLSKTGFNPNPAPFNIIKDGQTIDNLSYDTIFQKNPKYISLFWIDSLGVMQTYISNKKTEIYGLEVKDREYFKQINEKREWSLPNRKNKKFGFQSIVSWRTGKHLAIISKEDDKSILQTTTSDKEKFVGSKINLKAIAVSSHMSSVMDPLLVPGYGFCILDKTGNVWFHSKKENNLNENFFNEIDNDIGFRAAIKAQVNHSDRQKYRRNDTKILLQPIKGMPLFLATFYDYSSQQVRFARILTNTYLLFFISLILIGIHVLILFCITHRSSKLKKKQFRLDWLMPNRHETSKYNFLFLNNIVIIIFLMFTITLYFYLPWQHNNILSLDPVFTIFIAQFYILAYTFYVIKHNPPTEPVETKFLKYSNKVKPSTKFSYATILVIIALNILYLSYFESCLTKVLLFQLLLIVILTYLLNFGKNIFIGANKDKSAILEKFTKHIPNSYTAFCLSWIIIVTAIPIYHFYKYNNTFENFIKAKYEQVELAKLYENRRRAIYKTTNLDFYRQSNTVPHTILSKGVYIPNYSLKDSLIINSNKSSEYSEQESKKIHVEDSYEKLQSLINLSTNIEGLSSMKYIKNTASDYSWSYDKDSKHLYYTSSPNNLIISLQENAVKDRVRDYRVLLIIALLIALTLIYFIITFAYEKIFATDYKYYRNTNNKNLVFLKDRNKSRRVFLIRLNHASSVQSLNNYINYLKSKEDDYIIINLEEINNSDFIEYCLKLVKNSKVIIINNFEYLSNKHECWELKRLLLSQLKQLETYEDKQVIISSQQHPLLVIQYYETMLEKSSKLKWDPNFRSEYESYRHACSQWRKFYEEYITLSEPISKVELFETKISKYHDHNVEKFVEEELSYGTYLSKLEPLINAYCNELHDLEEEINTEDIVQKIQVLAEPYYYSLWSSLSREERFLVYDLAKDGFINVKNSRGIHMLLDKGIFVYENNLRLINKSFNNFILTVVDKSMEAAMAQELRQKGSWLIMRNVLFILAIGTITFIALGSPSMMQNVNAAIGGLITVLGLMLRSSALFTSGQPKSN